MVLASQVEDFFDNLGRRLVGWILGNRLGIDQALLAASLSRELVQSYRLAPIHPEAKLPPMSPIPKINFPGRSLAFGVSSAKVT